MNLSSYLFWDTKVESVDYDKNARWLIERVLSRGMMSDVRQIQNHYGNDRILSEMLGARYLDKRTLNFLSTVFQIPKEEFRCYNIPPSIRELWPS